MNAHIHTNAHDLWRKMFRIFHLMHKYLIKYYLLPEPFAFFCFFLNQKWFANSRSSCPFSTHHFPFISNYCYCYHYHYYSCRNEPLNRSLCFWSILPDVLVVIASILHQILCLNSIFGYMAWANRRDEDKKYFHICNINNL